MLLVVKRESEDREEEGEDEGELQESELLVVIHVVVLREYDLVLGLRLVS